MPERHPLKLRHTVTDADPRKLGELLQARTGLSRAVLKDALAKGALQLRRAKDRTSVRARKADTRLEDGDLVELGYDPELLAIDPPGMELLVDHGAYSGWYKPAGLLAQGNEFGDHCSALRQVEVWARAGSRETYLVQRLDRETYGVMVFAHNRKAATELSRLINGGEAAKHYRAVVHGKLEARGGPEGALDASLDGKRALTRYTVLAWDPQKGRTTVEVTLAGGRLHQIRRHFAAAGYPLVGDPRYGRGDTEPLKLAATRVAFHSELLGLDVDVKLPAQKLGF